MGNRLTHLAIIMDGNGRWAQNRGLSRFVGHKEGLNTVKKVASWCIKYEINYLTLFVFSTENWKRPRVEVDGLFSLASKYFDEFINLCKNETKIVVSGSLSELPKSLQNKIIETERKTASNSILTINLCINYGGRKEIVTAINKLLATDTKIDEQSLMSAMYQDIPEPDLIVRTGGEKRLSNFLLYQSAYSELYFSDTLWPDFTEEEFNNGHLDGAINIPV
ncbi:MAG: polyprenyl diphosphate synthase, partial [Clostridia bacterium]